METQNKTVMITGSSKGIGEGLALVFSKNGYNVIIHGRDKKKLGVVKQEIEKNNVSCHVVVGDITSKKNLDNLSDIARKQDISILINNAGLPCPYLPLHKINDEQVDDIINTNLIAPIKLTHRIYRFFLEKKAGTIVNINSLSGLESHYLRTIYCASKWGLRGFTNVLRKEAKENNIRIIGVYPGRTKTKPEYTYGMTVEFVANKIFDYCQSPNDDDLILDNRPKDVKRE